MPYTNSKRRRAYAQGYYHAHTKPKARGRPDVDDKKLILHMRVRASIVGRIQRALLEGTAKGSLTFRSTSAFYEHLLVQGFEHFRIDDQELQEQRDEAMQYLKAVSETDAIGHHRREAQGAFARVRTELKELLAIKAVDQAVHYYWSTRRTFEQMSANIWRDWFLRELEKAFPLLHHRRPTGVQLDDRGKVHGATKKQLLTARPRSAVESPRRASRPTRRR